MQNMVEIIMDNEKIIADGKKTTPCPFGEEVHTK